MAIFRYTALNRRGKEEKGIIDARDPVQARRILRQKSLYVRTLSQDEEKRERDLFPFLTKLLYRVPRKDVGLFARELGTLLDAGIPLDRSLAAVQDQTENIYLKKAVINLHSEVVEGASLSQAMKKHPEIFPPIYSSMIGVGEKTGTYEKALLRLADLEDKNQKLKNKVQGALAYPIFITILLSLIMLVLLTVVVPQVRGIYEQRDMDLPLITTLVFGAADFVAGPGILFTLVFFGGFLFFFFRWKNTEKGLRKIEEFNLKIPMFGIFFQKVLLARFSRNLAILLENRVSLLVSLQVVGEVVSHSIFSAEIQAAISRIKEGSRITDAFKDSKIMTQMMLGMLSAGEASDRIPAMIDKLADILEDDVDTSLQKLTSMLEPMMMVVMGIIIGTVMVALMMPMYSLTGQM